MQRRVGIAIHVLLHSSIFCSQTILYLQELAEVRDEITFTMEKMVNLFLLDF